MANKQGKTPREDSLESGDRFSNIAFADYGDHTNYLKGKLVMQRIATVFLIGLFPAFGLLNNKAWANGNFAATCKNVNLDKSTLSADCRRINGSYIRSSIDLNNYITNRDGTLGWGGDKFAFTCSGTYVGGDFSNILASSCRKINGSFTPTNINLNDHIANIDGQLKYQ